MYELQTNQCLTVLFQQSIIDQKQIQVLFIIYSLSDAKTVGDLKKSGLKRLFGDKKETGSAVNDSI